MVKWQNEQNNVWDTNIQMMCDLRKFFLRDFIYLFLERGWEGEREGEKQQCVVSSHAPLLGTWPAILDWELNQWPFGFQARTQSTEPHQPGQEVFNFLCELLFPNLSNGEHCAFIAGVIWRSNEIL